MHNTADGKFYEQPILVEDREIDGLNHVNNVRYLQWVQDVAGAHWKHTASAEEQRKYSWVVLRHEVDYFKPAFNGDELTGRTWVEKMEGVKSFRHVEIKRGDELLAKAVTIWIMLDATSGRPSRVPEEMATKFI